VVDSSKSRSGVYHEILRTKGKITHYEPYSEWARQPKPTPLIKGDLAHRFPSLSQDRSQSSLTESVSVTLRPPQFPSELRATEAASAKTGPICVVAKDGTGISPTAFYG
jgi:hypothetical protein